MPASLANRPRATPKRMAFCTVMPAAPPSTAAGSKAATKMLAITPGRLRQLQASTIRLPPMYSSAITGTSFSVTDTMRCTPPRKMNPATSATATPTTIFGAPKALYMASLMELDCTILPMNPSARMSAAEKKPASTLPNRFGNAARM